MYIRESALPVPMLGQVYGKIPGRGVQAVTSMVDNSTDTASLVSVKAHFILFLSIKPHLDHEIKVPVAGHLKIEPNGAQLVSQWSLNGFIATPLD